MPRINFYGTFDFLYTQDDMGLGISKRYSSYNFHLISAKLYDNTGYYGRIQAIIFLAIRPRFKQNL